MADDTEWALTLGTAEGAVLDALHRARLLTRFGMLESMTVVEDHRRRFADASGVSRLPDDEVQAVRTACEGYLGHHGHRTAMSQRARQAHADRFLGWATLPGSEGSTGYVVPRGQASDSSRTSPSSSENWVR